MKVPFGVLLLAVIAARLAVPELALSQPRENGIAFINPRTHSQCHAFRAC
jgi:hypothetical protein